MITNINQIIRDVVASSEDLDPHDVARRVLKELDPSDYENGH